VLEPGANVPDATVWMAPREPVKLRDLERNGPLLLVYFLFAWSRSQWESDI
jgi:hypothetical protein